MHNYRIIPVLLLSNGGLVKTIKFDNPRYIGDPLNAIKIFNEKEVDELVVLDISATKKETEPNYHQIIEIANECFMPICYGGGIKSIDQATKLFQSGVEKIAINSHLLSPNLITDLANRFGTQSIVASMDVKKSFFGKYEVYIQSGKTNTKKNPSVFAKELEARGVGEILLNSIDKDGTMNGYDNDLISSVASVVSVPVIACGGAGNTAHLKEAILAGASAVAAGSLFVFHGKHRAVLISYPSSSEIKKIYD